MTLERQLDYDLGIAIYGIYIQYTYGVGVYVYVWMFRMNQIKKDESVQETRWENTLKQQTQNEAHHSPVWP